VSMADATEQGRREDQQEMLIGELNHRIKNLLAVTASMARQTKVEGRTAAEFREVFLGRYAALARSLEITALGKTADLPDLARIVMKPFQASAHQVSINDGPKVDLPTRHAAPLGMILHELATNATKYGALSVPGGQVSINWEIAENEEPTPTVHLAWTETNGPKVAAPSSKGFGTRMIKFSAQKELSGDVDLDYRADGFMANIRFPKMD